jgi:hypothetical protein
MNVKIYDYETEATSYMTLKEFEKAFNDDVLNQNLCSIEFIGD